MSMTRVNLVTFIIALTLNSFLYAQSNIAPSILWQKSIGGSNDEIANCVKQTSDGGFIVAGTTNSTNGDIVGNHGQSDFWLMKLTATGNIQWQHCYGGSGLDEATSVVVTSDNGYAVVGKSSSHNGDVTGNHGSADYWLIKTTDQGTLQWQRSYGGSQSDVANSIDLTFDNGLVITGTSYSNDGDVTGNHGAGDTWTIKVDQNGNLQWQKIIGGTSLEIANEIKTTSDGGYFITGYSLSNNGDIALNKGQEDYLFFKLDGNGTLVWEKTTGGSGGDCASAGIQTMDGGYVICGLTHSSNYDVPGSHPTHDIWILKTNSTGETQWSRCLGGSDTDNGLDVKQQAEGKIIGCGYTGSTDGNVTGLHGLYDIWLTALDSIGNLLWQKTVGGSNYEYPASLQIVSSGQYIISGKSNSLDGDLTGNHGGYDSWVVRLGIACTNIYYADGDADGYGNINSTITACTLPVTYVMDSTDCSDNNAAIHPNAVETLNGLDDNCNGLIDDGIVNDADADGYSVLQGDCNDNNATVHPDAIEICNGIDDNCNGMVDDNAVMVATIIPSGTVNICSGNTLTLNANTGSGYTYQWKKNGSNISGAITSLYNTKIAANYTVTISSNSCTATSAPTTTVLTSVPAATITPGGAVNVCPEVYLTMNGNTGTGLTYQWQKNSTNISGATGSAYSTNITAAYKVIVTNSYGCSKTSDQTTFDNYDVASVKISSMGLLKICGTGSVILTAKVVSGYAYQWFKDNSAIAGATASAYTATQAGIYYYQATTINGCSAVSSTKTVTGCRVENSKAEASSLSVYPNPVHNHLIVELHCSQQLNATATIELRTMMGNKVLIEQGDIDDGILLHRVSLGHNLSPGLYFVKVIVEHQMSVLQIVVQ